MRPIESLKRRAGVLGGGLLSFLSLLLLMRWFNGEALLQPSGDFGIAVGAALVALYFIMTDARASSKEAKTGRARENR